MPPVAVRRRCLPRVICLLCLSVACAAHAQSGTLSGGAFALRSGGFASGSAWTLDDNGYVGTYITLSGAATVTFQIQAAGNAAGGAPPRLSLAVDDSSTSWNVSPSSGQYTHNVYLPAGTHFVRVAYDNFTPSAGGSLTIQSLQVGGASLVNVHSNANAIAAANTYINNYRKGTATVSLTGPGGIPLLSGTLVNVDLRRHAFNFGTAVPGSSQSGVASFLSSSGQYYPNFHPRLIQNFNMVVPENAGKWANNEATRDAVQMGNVDLILNYAEQNNLRARMHNLIWGNQQPTWVNQHLSNGSAGSLSALRDEISERIDYYIGTGSATDRARRYTEVDIYNESVHTTQYWNAYGASGIAGIYNEAAAAIAASGSTAKVFVNEYNVFQWGDAFGNWYRQHIEAIRNAGGTVQGIGAQYYVDTSSNANMWSPHGAARMMSVLQGLSVTGLPIALTEFGIKSTGTGTNTQSTDTNLHANILEDAVRMMFGTPNATGFTMWGFWRGAIWDQATYGAFYDMNWNLTPVGARWQQLMAEWDTNLNAVVNPDGSISFTGFFGDYNIGGQSGFANLSFVKGIDRYSLTLAAPADWHFWNTAASGDFESSANWTNGVPGGIGHTAHFGNAGIGQLVSLNAPRTLGMINFDSTGTYELTGGGTITMQGPAASVAINVVVGRHHLDVPIVLDDDLTVWIRNADNALRLSSALNAPGRTITKTGLGEVTFGRIRAGGLSIHEGRVVIPAGSQANDPSATASLTTLSIASGARLDLNNNSLIINAGSLSAITGQIKTGLENGGSFDWLGPGIGSTQANVQNTIAGSFLYGLGVILNNLAQVGGTGPIYTDFAGQTLTGNEILVKFTYFGDADLSGSIDATDYSLIDNGYVNSLSGWLNGDFDYSGSIDATDYALIDNAYVNQVGPLANAIIAEHARMLGGEYLAALRAIQSGVIPEPGALGACITSLLAGASCRLRRRIAQA